MTKVEFTPEFALKVTQNFNMIRDGEWHKYFATTFTAEANRQLAEGERPVFEVGKRYLSRKGEAWVVIPLSYDYPRVFWASNGLRTTSFYGDGHYSPGKEESGDDLLPGAIEESPTDGERAADRCLGGAAGESPVSLTNKEAYAEVASADSPDGMGDGELGRRLWDIQTNVLIFHPNGLRSDIANAEFGRRARELLYSNGHTTSEQDCVVADLTQQVREMMDRAEAAEARIKAVRLNMERDFNTEKIIERPAAWDAGYDTAMRNVALHLGLTIHPAIPATPLRVTMGGEG